MDRFEESELKEIEDMLQKVEQAGTRIESEIPVNRVYSKMHEWAERHAKFDGMSEAAVKEYERRQTKRILRDIRHSEHLNRSGLMGYELEGQSKKHNE